MNYQAGISGVREFWLHPLEQLSSEKRELRLTCIHEAGHTAVARYYGLAAQWVVFPNPTTAPHRQKLWCGQMTHDGNPPTRQIGRCIALAGVVAAAFHRDPFVSADEIEDALEWGDIELSALDAAAARGYGRRDVRRCHSLVLRLMQEILLDAVLWQPGMHVLPNADFEIPPLGHARDESP